MSEIYIMADPGYSVRDMPDYEEIRNTYLQRLREGVCRVTFTKKNGEERVMDCTLNMSSVPEDKMPKGTGSNNGDVSEIIKVYDIENEGWRSFRVDSVTSFFPLEKD